jgi:hypothetical protein
VVLRGTVELEEVMLHHQEEWVGNRRTGGTRQTRTRVVGAGEGFHHLPLVTSASTAHTVHALAPHALPSSHGRSTVSVVAYYGRSESTYGFSARTSEASEGASVVLIPRSDYNNHLLPPLHDEMMNSVAVLRATPFFASWTEKAILRVFFWSQPRRITHSTQPTPRVHCKGTDRALAHRSHSASRVCTAHRTPR